MDIFTQNQILN